MWLQVSGGMTLSLYFFGKNKAPSLKILRRSWWTLLSSIPLPDGGASSFTVSIFKTIRKCWWLGRLGTDTDVVLEEAETVPCLLWLLTVLGNDCMGAYLPRFISGFISWLVACSFCRLNQYNHSEILFSVFFPPQIFWDLWLGFCNLLVMRGFLVVRGHFEEAFCCIGSGPSRTYWSSNWLLTLQIMATSSRLLFICN